MGNTIKAWHFLPNNGKLANGDNRLVEVGKTYQATPVVICQSGLHWSKRLIDALQYAPGRILTYCEVWGGIQEQQYKGVSSHRKVIAMIDAESLLFEAARHFAAEVFWKYFKKKDYPDIVKWLDQGDFSARSAAWSAAWSAAGSAAGSTQNKYLEEKAFAAMGIITK